MDYLPKAGTISLSIPLPISTFIFLLLFLLSSSSICKLLTIHIFLPLFIIKEIASQYSEKIEFALN